ncbi:hypothetical protein HY522_00350 [bacterium]|nr:hypothetical protein [bacterium]
MNSATRRPPGTQFEAGGAAVAAGVAGGVWAGGVHSAFEAEPDRDIRPGDFSFGDEPANVGDGGGAMDGLAGGGAAGGGVQAGAEVGAGGGVQAGAEVGAGGGVQAGAEVGVEADGHEAVGMAAGAGMWPEKAGLASEDFTSGQVLRNVTLPSHSP